MKKEITVVILVLLILAYIYFDSVDINQIYGTNTAHAQNSKITASSSSNIQITTTSNLTGFVNKSFIATFKASGGTQPYTWRVSNGALPPGLQLKNATATSTYVNGTPMTNGIFSFTLEARDKKVVTGTGNFQITILDIVPPVRSNGMPIGALPSETTQTTLSLTTDETATCKYSTTANTTYSSMTAFTTTGGTSHSTVIATAGENIYTYYIKCSDATGNINTNDFIITFNVAPAVGAIRWDAWSTGTTMGRTDEIALTPIQWHDRIPFYSTIYTNGSVQIRLDDQYLMDQEIAYARAGGVDYWAFDYYGDVSPNSDSLNKYLASSQKSNIKFALILLPQAIEKTNWLTQVVNHFKDPQYVKVLGGRPLVYAFAAGGPITAQNLTNLRNATIADGLPNPYIVWMTWNVNDGMTTQLGLDAVSAYALAPMGAADSIQPYSNLANVDQQFWNSGKSKGLKVIPLVSTGWDPRPRYAYPPPWGIGGHTAVAVGSPSEIADNLQSAANWIVANPTVAESNTIIIYAWNEYAEGGWLVPLMQSGSARLDAIRKVIPNQSATDVMPPVVSITSPGVASVLQNTVTINADAFDNIAVSGVQFKLDENNLDAEDTTNPYSVMWDTSAASNAYHSLTATTRDAAGNTMTSVAVSVVVNNTV